MTVKKYFKTKRLQLFYSKDYGIQIGFLIVKIVLVRGVKMNKCSEKHCKKESSITLRGTELCDEHWEKYCERGD